MIFLFKWNGTKQDTRDVSPITNSNIFFAKQVINNACATQALFSVLMNAKNIKLGKFLANFKDFTKEFDSEVSICLKYFFNIKITYWGF